MNAHTSNIVSNLKKKYQVNNLEIYKVQKEQKYLAVKVTSMHMFSVL